MPRARTRRYLDPHWWVVVGTFLTLAALALGGSFLDRAASRTEASIETIERSLGVPLGHLEDTLRFEGAGGTLLQRAAATTGEERNQFLAQSIAMAETTTNAWTRYKAAAAGLPGEAALAAKYERDYLTAKAIAAEILVPIIQSNQPAPLPEAQLVAAERDRRDLDALAELYRSRQAREITEVDARITRAHRALVTAVRGAALLVLVVAALGLRLAGRAVTTRRLRTREADTAMFEGQLIRALELVRDDHDALRIAASAVGQVVPEARVAIAALPTGGTVLTPVVGALACGVNDPLHCPALRASASLQFADSTSLDTCPVLAVAGQERCAVTCWPISVGGSDAAILQAVDSIGHAPDLGGEVSVVVRRVGERLTIQRAFARFELQASRDALTGLLNRRSLEDAVAQLGADGIEFSVAFADIDHFKRLNDEQGHEAGDRALKAVSRTMRDSLRPRDLLCRWGGEEFVIVLPDCTQVDAVDAMERMRAHLAVAKRDARGAGITVSIGVAAAERGESFESAVARADEALLAAKVGGRDRVVAWAPGVGASPLGPIAPPTAVPR